MDPPPGPGRIYYDGGCGMCHRWVRSVAARDRAGVLFRFAPLGGPTFLARVPAALRASLPDSVVVETDDGRFLVRSDAALHVLGRLGGIGAWSAAAASLVPRPLRDLVYRAVARARRSLAPRPRRECPVEGETLRARFDP